MTFQTSYAGDAFDGFLTKLTAPESTANVGTDFVYVDDDFFPECFGGAFSLGRWKIKIPLRLEYNGWIKSAPVSIENMDYGMVAAIDFQRLHDDPTYAAGMSQMELAIVETVRRRIADEWTAICTVAERDLEN